MPSSHPPDCPWDASLILEEQQDKKNQDKKKIRDSGSRLKKQQERSEFLLRAVPVSMEATVGVNVAEDEKGELVHCLLELFQHRAFSNTFMNDFRMFRMELMCYRKRNGGHFPSSFFERVLVNYLKITRCNVHGNNPSRIHAC